MTIKENVLKNFSNRKAYRFIVDDTLKEVGEMLDSFFTFDEKFSRFILYLMELEDLKRRHPDLKFND